MTTICKWRWLVFEQQDPCFKSHGVSKTLAPHILRDIEARGGKLHRNENLPSISIDLPGMCCNDRPTETFHLQGLEIEIPSEDLACLVDIWKKAEKRKYGRYYAYKLHSGYRVLVLNPTQYEQLMGLFMDRIPEAERKAEIFWSDKKSPSEVLREIAAEQNGKPLEEIPDLGGHKVDRFRPKIIGQA